MVIPIVLPLLNYYAIIPTRFEEELLLRPL